MFRNILIATVVATGLCASSACVDPGCIRNSECGTGFDCKNARCIRTSDAGVTAKAGTGGSVLIVPKDAGSVESTQPDTGSTDTPLPDAGKM